MSDLAQPIFDSWGGHPPLPLRKIGIVRFLRQSQDNPILNWSAEAFEEEIIFSRLLLARYVTINNPDYIKHVLVDNADNYMKSRLARRLLGRGLGNGLLLSEGAFWLRQRRIMNPAFHHKRVAGFADLMVEEAAKTMAGWRAAIGRKTPIDLMADMMGVTLRIITATMFGSDIGERTADIHHRLTLIQNLAGRPGLADLFGLPDWFPRRRSIEAERSQQFMDKVIDDIIRARREDRRDGGDLLDMLLSARDDDGAGMTDKQIRDEVMTIFAAGHETTAVTLTWTWYLLSQHPAVERRLHEELDRVLQGRAPRYEDLPNLPYARMVIEESLRLFPPAYVFSRVAIGDDQVGPHRIPAGSEIIVVPWVLHRHKKLWKNPGRFDPERFAPDQAARRHPYAYLPFGGGPRVCIGRGFAMVEAQLILAKIAQSCRLRLVPGHPVEPQGLITLRPRYGMAMTVERR